MTVYIVCYDYSGTVSPPCVFLTEEAAQARIDELTDDDRDPDIPCGMYIDDQDVEGTD